MKKRLVSATAAVAVLLSSTVIPSAQCLNADLFSTVYVSAESSNVVVYDMSQMSTYKNRTLQDVVNKYDEAIAAGDGYVNGDKSTYYSVAASTVSPYNQGTLNQSTLSAMQGMTNFYRWLIGSPELLVDCTPNESLQYQALDRNFEFNHYISESSKPDDMDDELWEKGYNCSHNILALGYTPLGAITGWINEGYSLSSNKWSTFGHRNALLTPTYSDIQFGYSGSIAIGVCNASKNSSNAESVYAFPPQGYTPSSLISPKTCGWKTNFDSSVISVSDKTAVTVTITNLDNGNVYVRTSSDNTAVVSSNYVSFVQPEDYTTSNYKYYYTDSYKVEITGLTDVATGNEAKIQYTVDFFDDIQYTKSYVKSAKVTDYSTVGIYSSINNTESLNKIAAILPTEITVTSDSGLTCTVPVSGKWVLDEENSCWRNSADASSLPSNIVDKYGKLKDITISYSESGSSYATYNRLVMTPSNATEGSTAYLAVYRYMMSYPSSAIYKLTDNGDGTYSAVRKFDNDSSAFDSDKSSSSAYHYYKIDSLSVDDSGEYISVYYSSSFNAAYVSNSTLNVNVSHNYNSGVVTTAATCTADGVKTYTCTVCGMTKTESISATGHSYSTSWTIDKAATCTATGSKSHHCTNCDAKSDVTTIAKTAHTYNSGVVTTAATCTADGVKTYTCTVCGTTKTESISATGHSYDNGKITTAATCTADGVKTYTCTVCGTTKTESISATGHSYDNGKITTAATCTADGVKTYTCTVCGTTKTESISATGHSYISNVVAASYTATGYTKHTCKNCDNSYTDNSTAKKTLAKVKLTKFACTDSAVRIYWNKSSEADGYIIYRYDTASKKWVKLKTIKNADTVSYKNSGLKTATEYKYLVRAYITENDVTVTSASSNKLLTATKPVAPTITKTASTARYIKLSWGKVNGADGYKIQRYDTTKKTWVTAKTVSSSTKTYTVTGLAKNKTYKFRITAYKKLGSTYLYSAWSPVVSAKTKK